MLPIGEDALSDSPFEHEAQRTKPDYFVYVPGGLDGRDGYGSNEHFLVFDGPDGSMMAVWTQSPQAPGFRGAAQINRIVFARSEDEGKTWSAPRHVAGPQPGDESWMASWGFPLVSRSGRIYALYNSNHGESGWIRMHTGNMAGAYSDDGGRSWSDPEPIPLPTSPYDDPTGQTPPEWIVWQKPERDLSGGYFVGYSHWFHPDVAGIRDASEWTEIESVCEFIRFTNVDDDPEPGRLEMTFSAWGDDALRVPHRDHPTVSVAQEPSLVRLPDERLFCVMRTATGYVWWSQSNDDGATWTNPCPLLDRDHGRPLLNPVGCDPIYRLHDGRYVLLFHNNPGGIEQGGFNRATPRNPLFVALGEFRDHADQPVWFSPPREIMSTGGLAVDGTPCTGPGEGKNSCLSMYSSFTTRGGVDVLWYPDRKFFLLGRRIDERILDGLTVPGAP
jgi:hypothetical protein